LAQRAFCAAAILRRAEADSVRLSVKNHPRKRERLYIEAAAVYEDDLKARKFQEAYAEQGRLLRKLVKQYPKDTQAQIFLANNIMDGFDEKGEPRAGQKEALALFESVMKADPNNSAANHYYIHALEASAHPERALHSAEILASLAPSSGHMVHMPGHIYYRMGDYARAAKAFAASLQVDEQYMRDQHVQADNDWNYVHNLMYSVANLLEETQRGDRVFRETERCPRTAGQHPLFLLGARFGYAARSAAAGGIANGRLGTGGGIIENK
jgi:tetratricopeptide (TPR) repeat protein